MIENINDYKYVDLGLPSGTLWCDRNIGANNPTETGRYFQWGDTTEGTAIRTVNTDGTFTDENDNYKKLNKAQYDNEIIGSRLNRDIVPGGEFDTATVNLGSKWRMPTELQFKELFSDENTTKKFDQDNGSLILTSKNDKTKFIVLPLTGYIRPDVKGNSENSIVYNKNQGGDYWSTFIDTRNYNRASNLYFEKSKDSSITVTIDSDEQDYRWIAVPIRPVYYRSKIVSNDISTDEKNIQKSIGNLYEHFLDNKNFSINKINTIYDEETPLDSIDNTDDINKIILDRLMKTNDNYESNVTACSNSLIFYKYKYKQNSQESNKYYTGINLYYCDNKGLCFPITQNMYVEESIDNNQNNQENQNTPVVSDIKVIVKYDVTDSSSPITLYNSSYGSSNFAFMKVDTSEEEISPTSFYEFDSGEHTVEFTLANGVTSINQNAFMNCTSLKEITISDSITLIGQQAFSGCSGLTSITIPDSVTSIGDWVFNGCSCLTSINIPDSVTSIGNYAFNSCSGLTSVIIPNSVTSIGNWAFHNCSLLESITIGNSVTKIGEHAFDRCSKLTSITCNATNAPSISKNTFQDIAEEGTLIISTDAINYDTNKWTSEEDYYLGKWNIIKVEKRVIATYNVTSTSNATQLYNSSYGSSNFAFMKVDTSEEEISPRSSYEFDSGEHTVKFTLANGVTSIDMGAFSGCSALKKIIIADYITSIGDYAFSDCTSLEFITIGNSVTKIGRKTFQDCSSLKYITCNAMTAPEITNNTFENVEQNGILNVPSGAEGYNEWLRTENYYLGNYNWNNAKKTIIAKYYVDNTANETTLYNSFSCASMEVYGYGVVTPTSSYEFDSGEHMVKFTLANDVTSIGENAFNDCSALKEITIPNSIISIGENAFQGCSKLTSVTIPDSVTSIGRSAFSNCYGLTSVTIPDSVTSIGDSTFSYCSELTSVTIPDSVTSIGRCAFSNCYGLTSVTIPDSVTSIGDLAFYSCSKLTSINIPNSITSIGDSTFSYCSKLTSVIIPNSVTSIGKSAFYQCSSLTSVTIPDSITSIGRSTFGECSGLKSVTIPDSVTSIGESAFFGCGLINVTIGNSVTEIGNNAFGSCRELAYITCKATNAPSIQSETFINVQWNGILTVSTGSTGYDVWMQQSRDYLGWRNWQINYY